MNASVIVDFSPRVMQYILKNNLRRPVLRRSHWLQKSGDARDQELSDDTATSQKYRDTSVPRYFVTSSIVDNFLSINQSIYIAP